MNLIRTVCPPMHPEGRRFVAAFALGALLLALAGPVAGLVGAGLTVWCYYFFRDPPRLVPLRPGLVVSPADGIVSLVGEAVPPAGLGLPDAARVRISVFMSVFNCHVNRAPAEGVVAAVHYTPGRFLNASLDKASEHNERNALRIDLPGGDSLAVVQIAGLVARRILCWAQPGQALRRGERFGLIRFGSRLDIYLPPGFAACVAVGQTMVAGETVIAAAGEGAAAGFARS